MANARIGVTLPTNSSFTRGEDKCIILEGFVTDGTAIAGEAVKLDTTDPEKLVRAGDNEDAIGVLAFDPAWGVAISAAPTAGLSARVIAWGPCQAKFTSTGDNEMGGKALSLAPGAGIFGIHADGKYNYGTLLDKRGLNSSSGTLHEIFFKGLTRNDT